LRFEKQLGKFKHYTAHARRQLLIFEFGNKASVFEIVTGLKRNGWVVTITIDSQK